MGGAGERGREGEKVMEREKRLKGKEKYCSLEEGDGNGYKVQI